MWLFDNPPTEYLQSRYGFAPSPEWLEHIQKHKLGNNNCNNLKIAKRTHRTFPVHCT